MTNQNLGQNCFFVPDFESDLELETDLLSHSTLGGALTELSVSLFLFFKLASSWRRIMPEQRTKRTPETKLSADSDYLSAEKRTKDYRQPKTLTHNN